MTRSNLVRGTAPSEVGVRETAGGAESKRGVATAATVPILGLIDAGAEAETSIEVWAMRKPIAEVTTGGAQRRKSVTLCRR